jgi:nitrogen fixation negative regulator NifL
MSDKINVLLIEDTKSHANFISSCLQNEKYYIETVDTGKHALEKLLSNPPFFQVVLVDYQLPDYTGVEIIENVLKANQHYAFIFITVDNSLETVLKAMRAGARDFIVKNADLKKYLAPTVDKIYAELAIKLKHHQLQQHLQILSSGVEQSGSIIYITDVKGRIEYVNNRFTEITGYTTDDVIGKNVNILKSGNTPKSFYAELWQTILSGNNWKGELSNQKKNGEIYYVESNISLIKDNAGNILKFMAVQDDITAKRILMNELHRKTEELNFEKLLLEKIIDTIPNPIFVKDAHLKYTLCNTSFAKNIMGSDRAQIIGKTVFEIAPAELADFYFLADAEFQNEKINYQEYESQIRYADGSIHDALFYKASLLDEQNKFGGIVGIILDISERNINTKLIQDNARELKQMNFEKDRFLSIMAHDLKNSFNILIGFSTLLQKNWQKYEQSRIESQLQIINSTASNTYDLLEDLLLWAKALSGNLPFSPQPVAIDSLCKSIIQILIPAAQAKNIAIHCMLTERINAIGDQNMIKTILRNLIQNAIKFTPQNGTVTISAAQVDKNIKISVHDTGIGIADDVKQKLWDIMQPFSTAGTEGEGGTGLGLILCRELVNKHGGRIWVDSEVGSGSEFSFTLPSV